MNWRWKFGFLSTSGGKWRQILTNRCDGNELEFFFCFELLRHAKNVDDAWRILLIRIALLMHALFDVRRWFKCNVR